MSLDLSNNHLNS